MLNKSDDWVGGAALSEPSGMNCTASTLTAAAGIRAADDTGMVLLLLLVHQILPTLQCSSDASARQQHSCQQQCLLL